MTHARAHVLSKILRATAALDEARRAVATLSDRDTLGPCDAAIHALIDAMDAGAATPAPTNDPT